MRPKSSLFAILVLSVLNLVPRAGADFITPAVNSVFQPDISSITFSWGLMKGYTNFDFTLTYYGDTVATASRIAVRSTKVSATFPPGLYTASVRGHGLTTNTAWLTRTFTVLREMAPESGLVLHTFPAAFTWTRSGRADLYNIVLSRQDLATGRYVALTNAWALQPTSAVPVKWPLPKSLAASPAGLYRWTVTDYLRGTKHYTTSAYFQLKPMASVVRIPFGSFRMGDSFSEGWGQELPVRTVTNDAYLIGQYEVTKSAWASVRNWAVTNGYTFNPATGKGNKHPVCNVNWYDVTKWCNAWSEKENREPVYYTDSTFTTVYRSGTNEPFAKWTAEGYRLPTEAEWEKAARGGRSGMRFPWSSTQTISQAQANYFSDPDADWVGKTYTYDVNPTEGLIAAYTNGGSPYTTPVGTFPPNGYALYDMAGNVYEWCWDYGSHTYSNSTTLNPRGPAAGDERIFRGGSWAWPAIFARVACRQDMGGEWGDLYTGFRVVSSIPY